MTTVDSDQKPEAAGAAPEGTVAPEAPAPGPAGPGPAGPPPAAEPTAQPAAEPAAAAAPDQRGNVVVGIGIAVTLLGVLVLGFVAYLYWLSGLQEARAQTGMYANLRAELAAGLGPLGSASSGPIPPGTPVAILNISAIGVHNQVVVEGTSPENLTLGPGHLRSSALPGETGIAVLYGKRVTFGGPFAKLPQLLPGEEIQVTTGQGTSTYVVKVVGDSKYRILVDPAPNQLILLTADSAFAPSHYIEAEATLTSTPKANPGGRPAISAAEVALANDPTALIQCLAWAMALAAVSVGGTYLFVRWSKWPAYLVTVPIAIAILWNFYESLAALLPNLY
jgi:sortase A